MSHAKSNYDALTLAMKKYSKKVNKYSIAMDSIILLLIDTCNDINCKNSDGKTLMEMAIENKQPNIVKMLLKKGFNCNIKDSTNTYLLVRAYEFRTDSYDEILHLLIDSKGIDLDVVDVDYESILECAISNEHINIVRQIIKHKDDCANVLVHALQYCDNNKIINMIIDKSKHIDHLVIKYVFDHINPDNTHDECGDIHCEDRSELNHTIDRIDIVKKLIDRGADPFNEDFIKSVIRFNRHNVCKLIFDLGQDKNSLDVDGNPILTLNNFKCSPKVKKLLNKYKFNQLDLY